jgi:hypothetical protein
MSQANQPKTRSEVWFLWFLWALVIYGGVMSVVALSDLVIHPFAPSPYPNVAEEVLPRWIVTILGGIPTTIIGVMVLRRSHTNVIGLLLLLVAQGAFTFGISVDVSPWVYNLVSLPIPCYWVALLFIPLYFPDGYAFPRRLNGLLTAYYSMNLLTGFFNLAFLEFSPLHGMPPNPWYVVASETTMNTIINGGIILSLPLVVAIFVSPYLRYRHATFHERQQIKWLAWGGVLLFAPYTITYLIIITQFTDLSEVPSGIASFLRVYQILIVLYPPFTIFNAILRHKLYDIDIIIRRTLIYSVLTGILAVIYFGGVIITQQLFQAVTGDTPDIAIVLSTLLIAALFSPLRRRIQDVIDRRLYRRKYDVEQTLAQFNQSLRDEVDMKMLQANLIGAVNDTMQPDKIALWVKEKSV